MLRNTRSRFALEHRYLLVQAVKNVKKSETILREEDPFSDDDVVGDEAMTRYFVEYEENDIVKNLWYSVKKGEEEEITIMKLLQEMLNRTWCSSVESSKITVSNVFQSFHFFMFRT